MTVAAALGVAGLLVGAIGGPPLLAALAAAIILAMLEWMLGLPGPYASAELDTLHVAHWATSLLAASICLALLAAVVPVIALFVCEPLVPWGLSIAAFGAFASAWIGRGLLARTGTTDYHPVLHLALFWIAPPYGFFHAPWFLAQTLALPCPDRAIAQAAVAVAAMIAASVGGHRMGIWMFGARRS